MAIGPHSIENGLRRRVPMALLNCIPMGIWWHHKHVEERDYLLTGCYEREMEEGQLQTWIQAIRTILVNICIQTGRLAPSEQQAM